MFWTPTQKHIRTTSFSLSPPSSLKHSLSLELSLSFNNDVKDKTGGCRVNARTVGLPPLVSMRPSSFAQQLPPRLPRKTRPAPYKRCFFSSLSLPLHVLLLVLVLPFHSACSNKLMHTGCCCSRSREATAAHCRMYLLPATLSYAYRFCIRRCRPFSLLGQL